MRYCWIIHVEDVTEVIGYYDTSTVEALFGSTTQPR